MSKIIPYVQTENGWSIPEPVMVGIYLKMQEHALDKVLFVDSAIRNPIEWMTFIQHKSNVVHIIGNEKEIEAIFWLNCFGHNCAFAHFCCFPQTWGKNSVELGEMTLSYWFDWDFLDVVLGKIPATNKHAIDWTQRVGLLPLGTVPDIRYKADDNAIGAYFCYITKKDFKNGRRRNRR